MEILSDKRSEEHEHSRLAELARRVADVASALCRQGKEPTARSVRMALRGGSPNEIGPALKAWRECPDGLAALKARQVANPRLPIEIADLCAELWQRASIAAQLQASASVRSAESESAEGQLSSLREQLKRELIKYGELQSQSARHEASARSLGAQLEASERRERGHLRDLGEAQARIIELEATVSQLKGSPAIQTLKRRAKPPMLSRRPRATRERPKAKGAVTRPPPVAQPRSQGRLKHQRVPPRGKPKSRPRRG